MKRGIFNSKRFKYGTSSMITILVVVAILIFINLIAEQTSVKWDLTQNKLYSLSDQTIEVVENLEKDVNIYPLYSQGEENGVIQQIVSKYSSLSDKIKVEFKDPNKNPGFVKKYDKDGQGIPEGAIIIESGDKHRIINPGELVNYDSATMQVSELNVEQKVTSAIMYVMSDQESIVYLLKGHNETDIDSMRVSQEMKNENYQIKHLDLVTMDSVPQDADMILVVSPKKDLSDQETDKMINYLREGGRALFLLDIVDEDLANFQEVLKGFGLKIGGQLILEGDSSRHTGNPMWIAPEIKGHEITNKLISNDMNVILPGSANVEILDRRKKDLDISAILASSDKSWAKADLKTAESLEKEASDVEGPFNICVAAVDESGQQDKKDARIVVCGNGVFITDEFFGISGNTDLFMNTLNWLEGREERISIRAKSLVSDRLDITWIQAIISSIISIGIIPLIILIAGLIVWLRRRHL
ncbi:MAG: GldG family protein [Clostridia bacterium]|nr:GldG family protein [Clostridia bacterium]